MNTNTKTDHPQRETIVRWLGYWASVEAYIRAMEERQEDTGADTPWGGGDEITDYVPDFETEFPEQWSEGLEWGENCYDSLSAAHEGELAELLTEHGVDLDDGDKRGEVYDACYKLAMGVMGHGVGWGDDGEEPLSDNHDPDLESPYWCWEDFGKGDDDSDDTEKAPSKHTLRQDSETGADVLRRIAAWSGYQREDWFNNMDMSEVVRTYELVMELDVSTIEEAIAEEAEQGTSRLRRHLRGHGL